MQSSHTLPHAIDGEDYQSREELAAALASDSAATIAASAATGTATAAAAAAATTSAHYLSLPGSSPMPVGAAALEALGAQQQQMQQQQQQQVQVQMTQLSEDAAAAAGSDPFARHIHDGPNPGEDSDEGSDEEDEAEHFEKMTQAQMRMGAIFGRADDSETMQLRSDNNIILFIAVYFVTIIGWVFVDDDFVSLWVNPMWLASMWLYFWLYPVHRRRWKSLAHFWALDDEIYKYGLLHSTNKHAQTRTHTHAQRR